MFFLIFPACFWIPIIFSNLNYNCSKLFDMRKLLEQVKKAFCYQILFWPFTVWINCSRDLKNFANSQPSASNFKRFFSITRNIFLTVGLNNVGNKIPLLPKLIWPTVRKYCTSDWEKLLKFEAEGREFANSMRSLEQFIQTVKGQNNIW